jgi:hypothetical protein
MRQKRQPFVLAGGKVHCPARTTSWRVRLIAAALSLAACVTPPAEPTPGPAVTPPSTATALPDLTATPRPTESILDELDALERQAAAALPRASWWRLTIDITRLDGLAAARQSRDLGGTGVRDYAQGRVELWRYYDEDGALERELRVVRNPAGQVATASYRDQNTVSREMGSQLDAFASGLETSLRVQVATGLQAGGILDRSVILTPSQSVLRFTLTVRTALVLDPTSNQLQRGTVTEFDVDPATGQVQRILHAVILEDDQTVQQAQAVIARERVAHLPADLKALAAWAQAPEARGVPQAPVLAIDPAGAWVAIGRQDRLAIYETASWKLLQTMSVADYGGLIRSADPTADGRTLALGLRAADAGAMGVLLVDTASWRIGSSFRLDTASDLLGLAWSPDGQALYAPAENTGITQWTVRDGASARLTPPAAEQGPLTALDLSRDGSRLAGLGRTGISVWALAEAGPPSLLIGDPTWGAPVDSTWAPDSVGLWAMYANAWLVLWNTSPIGVGEPIDLGWGASSLALSPDSSWLATDGDRLRIWEARTLTLRWQSDPLPIDLVALAWMPTNLALITLDALGTAEIWNTETGERSALFASP